MLVLAWALAALVTGSLVYCGLVLLAAGRYRTVRPCQDPPLIPLSVLKPLAGMEEGLAENLRTFFQQDYPDYELLFAVRQPTDAAVPVAQSLQAEFPHIPAQILFVGEPPYPNAKVYSLDRMMSVARHEVLVMSDSDIRVTPLFLRSVASEFADPHVGLSTCPYRAVPNPKSAWGILEALMINSEFLSGVLVARMLEGMKFALGPTIIARREVVQRIGGFDSLQEFLAEDFVMGRRTAEAGYKVVLSSYVIEHHIGGGAFRSNARHRLRWNRSTRRSRPAGYVGQLFTNPLPLALLLVAVKPAWYPLLLLTLLARAAIASTVAGAILHDPLSTQRWYLIPLADIASFLFYLAGFFGNTILWRGRRYYLRPDGRFRLVAREDS